MAKKTRKYTKSAAWYKRYPYLKPKAKATNTKPSPTKSEELIGKVTPSRGNLKSLLHALGVDSACPAIDWGRPCTPENPVCNTGCIMTKVAGIEARLKLRQENEIALRKKIDELQIRADADAIASENATQNYRELEAEMRVLAANRDEMRDYVEKVDAKLRRHKVIVDKYLNAEL